MLPPQGMPSGKEVRQPLPVALRGLPSCGRERQGGAEDGALRLYILIALASSKVPIL